jgi:SAM-dependent methyltransferase
MPFRPYIAGRVEAYHTLDVDRGVQNVDFVADAQDMAPVPSDAYDMVMSSQVLEHVREPERALAEMWRVLRPAGTLILTVPFLSRLHEEPFDFYRFTTYGLRFLLERARFEIVEIVPSGSVFSFLGHQVSTGLVCSVWHIPLFRDVVFWLNTAVFTLPLYGLDRLLRMERKIPLNYVVLARKAGATSRVTEGYSSR